jgi:hypothetical protein
MQSPKKQLQKTKQNPNSFSLFQLQHITTAQKLKAEKKSQHTCIT